ncbi:MAG: low molecular weight protein-tyrosine-phosphatase [Propionicimonas sp.]|nr:low molecular weight protein-tyrosine-phosphatase [Propionicimonas sp.]
MSGAPTVMFVCWGNICRSPMAEVVARQWGRQHDAGDVVFASAGVSSEEQGNPIDPRAVEVLQRAGYRPGDHRAHRITAAEVRDSALVIGMERIHLDRIRQLVPEAEHLFLLSNFDPDAVPGSDVPDPWYGPPEGFEETLAAIEAAMPGLMRRVARLGGHAG